MTDLAAPPTTIHPLDRLAVEETQQAVEIVRNDERFGGPHAVCQRRLTPSAEG